MPWCAAQSVCGYGDALQVVATGLGFAIMSRVIAEKEVRLGELVQIPLAPPLIRHLSVVYPKERFQSKLVNCSVAFARKRLAAMATRASRLAAD